MLSRRVALRLTSAIGASRRETFNDKEYLVFPVTGLVQGVVWPSNSDGPEFVPAEVLAIAPGSWDGRPIFFLHPKLEGNESSNKPELLEAESFGQVFHTAPSDEIALSKRLTFEAWIDIIKATTLGGEVADLVAQIESGTPCGVSVGAYVEYLDIAGEWEGQEYARVWRSVAPDHLALLPDNVEGACNIEMGCGVLVSARRHLISASGISIQEATVPAPTSTTKTRSLRERTGSLISALFSRHEELASAEEQTASDMHTALSDALRKADLGFEYVEDFKPLMTPPIVFYSGYWDRWMMRQRSYSVAADGAVTLGDDAVEVHPTLVYTPVTAAAAATPPCSCHLTAAATSQENVDMNTKERVKALIAKSRGLYSEADAAYLEAKSDDQLKALETVADATPQPTPQTPVSPTPTPTQVPTPTTPAPAPTPAPSADVAAAPKVETEEEMLAKMPETATLVRKYRAQEAARKSDLVSKLEKGQKAYTKAELEGFSVEALEKLAIVAKVDAPKVDFSVRGGSAPTDDDEFVPAPTTLTAKIREQQERRTSKSTH
jgi:hypothetical protein